jgi:hypothetical protein
LKIVTSGSNITTIVEFDNAQDYSAMDPAGILPVFEEDGSPKFIVVVKAEDGSIQTYHIDLD